MLQRLTRAKKGVDFLKQCSAIQFIKLSRKESSKIKNNDEDKEKYKDFVGATIPRQKILRGFKQDWKNFKRLLSPNREFSDFQTSCKGPETIPDHCDVLIIGGGAMGSSTAYWLKQRVPGKELKVVVVEKDSTYAKASTPLSNGGLRQQFSIEENIHMSLFGAEFVQNVNEYLGIPGEPPVEVNFKPHGYLLLSTEPCAETLVRNSKLQNSLGAKNIILTPEKLKERFPWVNIDGIAVGCFGLEKEGWFDPWSLLCALKRKAIHLGAQYVNAEVKAFQYAQDSGTCERDPAKKLQTVLVKTNDGEIKKIKFSKVVIAAGAFSGYVAKLADIGLGKDLLSVPLPVEPRKRYVYCFHSPDGPDVDTPLTIDASGTYFRRESRGCNYICGKAPESHEEPSVDNLDVDQEFFDNKVWPLLANRVPAFENLKVKSSWAGYYEHNTFDQNGIIGLHPYYRNLYIATGFSGHGIQQSPAVGRAISELILDKRYSSIDLSKLGFERFLKLEPMTEANIF